MSCEQATLFDGARTATKLQDSIQERFEKFHAENPHVYEALVERARNYKARGYRYLAIRVLFERQRWEGGGSKARGQAFKLCNDFHSRYARLIMEQEPDLRGFFATRLTKAERKARNK